MKKTIHTPHGKIISQKLADLRKKSGMTQRELASKLVKRHSFVAHCELGERRVDLAEFYWICKACGADPHEEVSELISAFDII